jgi:predicted nuclease with TOPRIM domain
MAHLYELTEQYRNISELLDDDSMPPEVLSDALAVVEGNMQAKAQNCAIMLQTLELGAEMLKSEVDRLNGKLKAVEGRRDWLKNYIKLQLELSGIKKLTAGTFTLSVQNNAPSVEIHDSTLIPAKYLTIVPQTVVPNKTLIKKAIKDGEEVPGATTTVATSLRIR